MTFNDKEKEQAKTIAQTVNNYYGNTNIVNGSMKRSQIIEIEGDNNSLSISTEELKDVLKEFEEKLRSDDVLSPEDKETALEILEDIHNKIDSGKKQSIIKSALVGLKDFLITAGGGLVANLLYTVIARL